MSGVPSSPVLRVLAAALAVALVAGACADDGDDAAADAAAGAEADATADATGTAAEADAAAADAAAGAEPAGGVGTAGDGPVGDGPGGTDPADRYDFSAVGPVVEAFLADNGLDGAGLVVVERDDGVVHQEHWGDIDEDRVSLVASSSKMITAGVLLALDDRGLLDIDAPVADVVDWGAGNPTITPAQLLSNSSGLPGLLPDPAYAPYVCQYQAAGTLQSCAATIFTTTDDDTDVVAPDTEFRYGGAQWQVAGAVAEVASGRSWSELVEEIYVEPCGLEALGYNNHFSQPQVGGAGFSYPTGFDGDPGVLDPTDNPNMEGGAYLTTGDYAALLLMHLRGGRCGDEQVLSPEALAAMHGDRILEAYGGAAGVADTARGAGADTGYGLGWWVDRATGRLTDPGAYGSVPWLDLEDGYGAYLVVEADSVTGGRLAAELFDVVESAVLAGR